MFHRYFYLIVIASFALTLPRSQKAITRLRTSRFTRKFYSTWYTPDQPARTSVTVHSIQAGSPIAVTVHQFPIASSNAGVQRTVTVISLRRVTAPTALGERGGSLKTG
jgi:hypothetical protein